jgi:hypothetical protein
MENSLRVEVVEGMQRGRRFPEVVNCAADSQSVENFFDTNTTANLFSRIDPSHTSRFQSYLLYSKSFMVLKCVSQ